MARQHSNHLLQRMWAILKIHIIKRRRNYTWTSKPSTNMSNSHRSSKSSSRKWKSLLSRAISCPTSMLSILKSSLRRRKLAAAVSLSIVLWFHNHLALHRKGRKIKLIKSSSKSYPSINRPTIKLALSPPHRRASNSQHSKYSSEAAEGPSAVAAINLGRPHLWLQPIH